MQFNQLRKYFTEKSTISEVYLGDIKSENFICYILEDKDRGLYQSMSAAEIMTLKQKSITAIPYGKYQIVKTFSNRFQKEMPLLVNVKGFEGIRIHEGNKDIDTDGCLIPGLSMSTDIVQQSILATKKVYKLIDDALARKELIYINIIKKSNGL